MVCHVLDSHVHPPSLIPMSCGIVHRCTRRGLLTDFIRDFQIACCNLRTELHFKFVKHPQTLSIREGETKCNVDGLPPV